MSNNWIVGFGGDKQEYVINGVKYIVESRFQKPNYNEPKSNTLLNSCVENYLKNDFADLTDKNPSDKMVSEYVCSAAGEED